MSLRAMLQREEGYEARAYPDPDTGGSPWTIGIGHCGPEVHRGLQWTGDQIEAAFAADLADATDGCRRNFPWLSTLNEPRQAVLIAMAFQMGMPRLLGFTKMLAAARDHHFATAAEEMRQSTWAHQTPKRCIRMAWQMECGEWQVVTRGSNPEDALPEVA